MQVRFAAKPLLILAFGLLASALTPATEALAGSRAAAMVIDGNSGEVLHAHAADEPRYPASLTKMMTLYLVFAEIERGRLKPDTKIKISQEAAAAAPSKLDLDPGEEIALIDAIKALITKSANDVAVAVAEHIAGSERRFAELMTAKAHQIGMHNTQFRNASGLPDPEQVTTARDMLTLALRLQDDFSKHYALFATRSFTHGGNAYRNHNTLLGRFEGVDGIKTGYTRLSGFNLVTSVRRGEKHLVAAVFGGASAGTRNATMRLLLTRALLKASSRKTRKAAPMLVAEAKLAPRPAVRNAPAPAASAKPANAAQPLPPRVEAVENIEPALEPPGARFETVLPPIHVAKVRPVLMAPRARPQPPEAVAPEPTAAVAAFAAPLLASRDSSLSGPGRPPSTFDQQLADFDSRAPTSIAALLESSPDAAVSRGFSALPSAAAGRLSDGRGAAPSTLQQQAENLARGETRRTDAAPRLAAPQPAPAFVAASAGPTFRLGGPDPAPPAPATGFVIQIGAFASPAEAERALAAANARAGTVLTASTAMTTPIQKGERQLHRARFGGFSAAAAASACAELRRHQIDCFVMRAE